MRRVCLFLLSLPLLTSGCLTHRLWIDDSFDEWNGPAAPANLRLYRDAEHDDTLVVYDEYSDRCEKTWTRAYFLNLNQSAEIAHRPPHFVKEKIANNLEPLPIFSIPPTNAAGNYFAVMPAGTNCFTLFTNGNFAGRHELPLYNDGLGRMEKAAWTPLAVTADLTVIGGCVGVLALYGCVEWWNLTGSPWH